MALIVSGVNHKTAPVELREKLSFNDDQCKWVDQQLQRSGILKETVVLSTCNRTEVYGVVTDRSQFNGKIPKLLSDVNEIGTDLPGHIFYHKFDDAAVSHLFRVAGGLDSMVLGEAQILGQLKNGYRCAAEAGTTGLLINKLFHHAFRTGKRVRNETRFGEGAVSIGSVAVELAKKIYLDIAEKKVALIGAGEMAAQTAAHLTNYGIRNIFILNRTFDKAIQLARRTGGVALSYDKLESILTAVDIVIASTSAKKPIITREVLLRIMENRKNRPLLIIDISVPRNIDPSVKQVYNTYVYDIDDLKNIVDQNWAVRKKEIPRAEKIINEEQNAFMSWYQSLSSLNTIQQLHLYFEDIRKKELSRNKKYFKQEDWEQMEKFSRSLMKKFLHNPITRLKTCSDEENWCDRCTVKKIFGVEDLCQNDE
ncbi:MAG: glutamyl-tRNA reductase [bacterium]|nr:glutamyl-tRNA reductase [bacterium]